MLPGHLSPSTQVREQERYRYQLGMERGNCRYEVSILHYLWLLQKENVINDPEVALPWSCFRSMCPWLRGQVGGPWVCTSCLPVSVYACTGGALACVHVCV